MSESLENQLDKNRQTWSELNEMGVRPGDMIEFDAFFFAPDEEGANQLAAALATAGWVTDVSSLETGVFRRKVTWSVSASKQVPAVDLAKLDELVTELEAAAARHGAEFDGWGTEVQEGSN